ncbi:MAG: bifunctional heptose 7-phosphate kinase/heptose 1-phosphate adenyltransferase, partial [Phycisphaerae bacterium]|nr:bifunctional heptose 7-phosphate kinase/heptose 1-phosphate adenyltransferase [Phycisphaerae bacterium]
WAEVRGLHSKLIKLVQSFRKQRVLLIGDLILDRYVYGDAERISPEAPVAVLKRRHHEDRVGGTGSVAASLVTLGMKVTCCGVVGLDDAGHRVRAMLEDLEVGTRGVLSLPDRPTTTKTRFVGLAQHRHPQQLLRLDHESCRPLSEEDEDRLLKVITRFVPAVDIVCIEDYDKGVVSEALCRHVIEMAAEEGKAVLVDPARLKDYGKYRGASALTPNRSEFAIVAGLADDQLSTIREVAAEFAESLDLEALVITLDREGALLRLRGDAPVHVSTRVRSVYDNAGAGDAVLAMLAASVAAGASWLDATRLSNIAGGLEVEKFGCVPITKDEVIADLRLADRASAGKLRTVEELLPELDLRRRRGETVVFTNGCFDLLHPGHMRYLAQCRELGNIVIVGLNTDRSVQEQAKATDRPIQSEAVRAEMLSAVQYVDYVVLFDEPVPEPLIRKIRPDVLVKGEDWAERGVSGREFVEANGGRVVLLKLESGFSTTALIERIRKGTART